jgi:hypothetical protein
MSSAGVRSGALRSSARSSGPQQKNSAAYATSANDSTNSQWPGPPDRNQSCKELRARVCDQTYRRNAWRGTPTKSRSQRPSAHPWKCRQTPPTTSLHAKQATVTARPARSAPRRHQFEPNASDTAASRLAKPMPRRIHCSTGVAVNNRYIFGRRALEVSRGASVSIAASIASCAQVQRLHSAAPATCSTRDTSRQRLPPAAQCAQARPVRATKTLCTTRSPPALARQLTHC